jgi:hypothetical protein
MVDQVIDRQNREERQGRLDAINENRYQERLTRQDAQTEKADRRYNDQIELSASQYKDSRSDADRSFGLQQKTSDANITASGLSAQSSRQQITLNDMKIEEAKNTVANNNAEKVLWKMNDNPDYIPDEADSKLLKNSIYGSISNRFGDASKVNEMKQWFAQSQGMTDPAQLEAFINDPKTLSYSTDLMRNELRPREKATGNKYDIVGWKPVQGGVTPLLRITDKKGNVISDGVPATSGKGGGKEESVMVVPIKDLKQKVSAMIGTAELIKSDPRLSKVFGSKGGEFAMSGGYLYNKKTGAGKQVGTAKGELSNADIQKAYFDYKTKFESENFGGKAPSIDAWKAEVGLGSGNETNGATERVNAYLAGRNGAQQPQQPQSQPQPAAQGMQPPKRIAQPAMPAKFMQEDNKARRYSSGVDTWNNDPEWVNYQQQLQAFNQQ